jgi:Lar family restriction alleviation protein
MQVQQFGKEYALNGGYVPPLLPCPFCGYRKLWPEFFKRVNIACETCGGEGPPGVDIEAAAGAWNRRARLDEVSGLVKTTDSAG